MKDEIRAMVYILADLKEKIARAIDKEETKRLKEEYRVSMKRLEQMYAIQEDLMDLKYKTPEHEHLELPTPIPLPDTDNDVYAGEYVANPLP